MNSPHLDDDTIEALAMKRLYELAESDAVEHLLICESCRTRLDEAEEFIATLRAAGEGSDRSTNSDLAATEHGRETRRALG
ncbi:MAG: hypothetical protein JWN14_303 [Chthonomonadales bacterium]|nr:hypothetical protein [Chthonomonadales bacterium]